MNKNDSLNRMKGYGDFYQDDEVRVSESLSDVSTPLAKELKEWELRRGFSLGRVNYIPHLEGGDARAAVLRALAMNSPTLAACNNLYLSFGALNSDVIATRSKNTFGKKGIEEPINEQAEQNFGDFLSAVFGELGLEDLHSKIAETMANMLYYGNSWLELRIDPATKQAAFHVYDGDWGRYYRPIGNSEPIGDRVVICEDFFNVNSNAQVSFKIIGAFPNFTKDEETGILSTVFHTKNKVIGRNFYGLPHSIASVQDQMREHQLGIYGTVAYDNQFVSSTIIEVEQGEFEIAQTLKDEEGNKLSSEEAEELAVQKYRRLYQFGGGREKGKSPFVHMVRPSGAAPATFYSIPKIADTNYHKFTSDDSARKILMTCNVNPILFNSQNSGMSDSGNALYQASVSFMNLNVKGLQEQVLKEFRRAIAFLMKAFGYDNPDRLTIGLTIPSFLDALKPAQPSTEAPIQPESPVSQPSNTSESASDTADGITDTAEEIDNSQNSA